MGKERFLKELGLHHEVVESGETKSKTIRGDSESEDKKPHPPTKGKGDAPETELEAPQPIEESAEHLTKQPPAKEPGTKQGEQPEVEERQTTPTKIEGIVADEAISDSGLFLGREAADVLEPGRVTMAAASILLPSLLGTKRAWVWIVVLVCVAIAGCLLFRWYSERGESISPSKQEPQTVEEFMGDFRRNTTGKRRIHRE